MNHLRTALNVASPLTSIESNFERLDRSLAFALNPSLVGAAPTTDPGPPTTGTRYLGELWVDALCAGWRCTVAGTPGTWVQISEPIVADTTERDAISAPPTGYRVITDDDGERHRWDGAAWGVI